MRVGGQPDQKKGRLLGGVQKAADQQEACRCAAFTSDRERILSIMFPNHAIFIGLTEWIFFSS